MTIGLHRRVRRNVRVAALALLCATTTAGQAEEGLFPVRVNPRLELESADPAAIEARIRGPLWPSMPDDGGFDLYRLVPLSPDGPIESFDERIIDVKVANDCIELRALSDAGYEGRFRNDWEVQRGLLNQCYAFRLIQNARAAETSYVQDFMMNAAAVDVLPVMVNNGALFDRLCDEYIANHNAVPWSAFDKIVEIKSRNEFDMIVLTEHRDSSDAQGEYRSVGGGYVGVEILAWADFNADGIEDLLISSYSRPLTWYPDDADYFVHRDSLDVIYLITRDSPGSVLRVIDAEQYLTDEWLDGVPCPRPNSTP